MTTGAIVPVPAPTTVKTAFDNWICSKRFCAVAEVTLTLSPMAGLVPAPTNAKMQEFSTPAKSALTGSTCDQKPLLAMAVTTRFGTATGVGVAVSAGSVLSA